MVLPIGIPLPETLQNPAHYPTTQAVAQEFQGVDGTKSLWAEVGMGFLKDHGVSMAIAGVCVAAMSITGGPLTFFLLAIVTSVLNALMRAGRFYFARSGNDAGYNCLTNWGNPFLLGLFSATTLMPLIQGGFHALFSPLFFRGGIPSVVSHLFAGHSLAPASASLTSFGTLLGEAGSKFLCSLFGSLASIVSASLLLSLSKQAAKVDPDLANFLWVTAIGIILGEFFNAFMTTVTTGNPLYLLVMPLALLAYPLVLLFDWMMNSCCPQRAVAAPAAAAPQHRRGGHLSAADAVARVAPAGFVPFSGVGRRLDEPNRRCCCSS